MTEPITTLPRHPMRRSPLRLALLGAGGIAGMVGDALVDGRLPGFQCVAVAGSTAASASAAALAGRLGARAVAPEELQQSGADWVVEAAGTAAVRRFMPGLWDAGINTVVMSVGAFADDELWAGRPPAVKVILPSGGIAGLDGVKAMAAGGDLLEATITTTKHPRALQGAPYLVQNSIELPTDRAIQVFAGSAREAVAGFPANVNVAIALSLAGLGPDRTRVVVRSDPEATRNHHLIEVRGNLCSISVSGTSEPNPANPRTSFLAGASAVAALQELAGTK